MAGRVLTPDLFRDVPVLTGSGVRLEPLGPAVLEDYLVGLADPEVRRLTASRHRFERDAVARWLATRSDHADRADWAVHRRVDGRFLGEAVLTGFDAADASACYRVWLGPGRTDAGHGTETTRLVLDHAFGAGLHRVWLVLRADNPRARRTYEKCGFRVEGRGRDALRWDGRWVDERRMAVLATAHR